MNRRIKKKQRKRMMKRMILTAQLISDGLYAVNTSCSRRWFSLPSSPLPEVQWRKPNTSLYYAPCPYVEEAERFKVEILGEFK